MGGGGINKKITQKWGNYAIMVSHLVRQWSVLSVLSLVDGLRKGAGVERGPERMLNRKKNFYFINRVKIIVNYYKGKKYLYFLKIF